MVAAVCAATACSDSTQPGGCSPETLRPAIVVHVVAASGPPISDTLTKGAVRDGDYIDSLKPIQGTVGGIISLGAAVNRPGTYDVTVEHPGYLPFEKDSVVVQGDACGIKQSVTVVASMHPTP
ncbi:MAG TPA: hypothetical protein VF118_01630 [Gemmatimonadaceae bacterium]